ncbi:hypothetical protein [Holospora curviuscula]|uniref:Uncharacterized protein n=1 Tax=Holospora curviuscula TaxID=1082868 RepID=A0A2S5R922_9PROT|nr:hypothetical protein [Holospora curviuscula]PPE03702.1 hypothetical protein HCUR_00841 [Holospora curviuscula]
MKNKLKFFFANALLFLSDKGYSDFNVQGAKDNLTKNVNQGWKPDFFNLNDQDRTKLTTITSLLCAQSHDSLSQCLQNFSIHLCPLFEHSEQPFWKNPKNCMNFFLNTANKERIKEEKISKKGLREKIQNNIKKFFNKNEAVDESIVLQKKIKDFFYKTIK